MTAGTPDPPVRFAGSVAKIARDWSITIASSQIYSGAPRAAVLTCQVDPGEEPSGVQRRSHHGRSDRVGSLIDGGSAPSKRPAFRRSLRPGVSLLAPRGAPRRAR